MTLESLLLTNAGNTFAARIYNSLTKYHYEKEPHPLLKKNILDIQSHKIAKLRNCGPQSLEWFAEAQENYRESLQ